MWALSLKDRTEKYLSNILLSNFSLKTEHINDTSPLLILLVDDLPKDYHGVTSDLESEALVFRVVWVI